MEIKRYIDPITQPDSEALSLGEVKHQLRLTHDGHDYYLSTRLVPLAREAFENAHDHSVMPRDWRLTLNCFPAKIYLKMPPIISIASIKYTDVNGAEQTIDPADYSLVKLSRKTVYIEPIAGKCWPSTYAADNAVRVEYKAGYADEDAVPYVAKQWMLDVITQVFNNEDVDMSSFAPNGLTNYLDCSAKL